MSAGKLPSGGDLLNLCSEMEDVDDQGKGIY